MEPSVWKQQWGVDRLVYLDGNEGILPVESESFLKTNGLPRVVVFEIPSPFEIHFSPLQMDLVAYNTKLHWGDFYDADLDVQWADQIVVGEQDFSNGSASYCIHRTSGVVSRIDCELSQPTSF